MSRIAVIAFIISSGCAVSPEDAAHPDTLSVESALTVVPVAGVWSYAETGPVFSTCNNAPTQAEAPGPFTVDNVTASSFHVVPSDGTPSFTCSHSGDRFDCPDRGTATMDLRPTTDAVITAQGFATGLLLDSRHAAGKQDALVTCTGSQCGEVLGPNPCGLVVNFEAHMP